MKIKFFGQRYAWFIVGFPVVLIILFAIARTVGTNVSKSQKILPVPVATPLTRDEAVPKLRELQQKADLLEAQLTEKQSRLVLLSIKEQQCKLSPIPVSVSAQDCQGVDSGIQQANKEIASLITQANKLTDEGWVYICVIDPSKTRCQK